jgi:hypothetical protein
MALLFMPKTHFIQYWALEFIIMAKVTKQGQVGSRMSEAAKEAANQARLAKAAKQAAKTANKSKAAKKAKSVFKAVQVKKIFLTIMVSLIPTEIVSSTWDNAIDNYVEPKKAVNKPVKKAAAKVSKPFVGTGTKADKFKPSPVKVVEETISSVLPQDPNKDLKEALKKAMYDSFYKEQSEAVANLIFAKKSEIHAAYTQQYKEYKDSIKSVISVVTDEFESIKAQVNLDLNSWADQEVASYEAELSSNFEAHKSVLMQEALDEAELPDGVNADTISALIAQAKEAEKQAKLQAAKDAAAKKLAAIDAYNNKQKAEAKQSIVDKHLACLAKAKKDIFYYSKVVTAQATKAVVTNCSSVTKMNKEQAKQYLDLFLELQTLVKKAKDVAGTKEFTTVLNAIYKVGSALSALYKTLSNDLGYSLDMALENILNTNLQEFNSVEAVMSLSEKEKTNRRVIVVALDKLESK